MLSYWQNRHIDSFTGPWPIICWQNGHNVTQGLSRCVRMITDRSLAMPMEYVDDDFDNSVLLPSSNLLSRALRKYHWLKSAPSWELWRVIFCPFRKLYDRPTDQPTHPTTDEYEVTVRERRCDTVINILTVISYVPNNGEWLELSF